MRVRRRFPKLIDLIDAGLLTKEEWAIFDDIEKKYPGLILKIIHKSLRRKI
jgi:hypothetical protein